MTEAAQWTEINYPSFFGAIGDKITAAKSSMSAIPVAADQNGWLETNVNNVPIHWQEQGADVHLRVGKKDNGEPFYSLTVPFQWLAA